MSSEYPSDQPSTLNYGIASCTKCLDLSVVEDWLPISYFGDYKWANAWVLAINPSDREFLDRQGRVLTGEQQRFRRLEDFAPVSQREELSAKDVSSVLAFQDSIFERVPYRPFFNRIGKFISQIHAVDSDGDPLAPFRAGVTTTNGRNFRYAHLDIVKCATTQSWSELSEFQTAQLKDNCLPFLEQQLQQNSNLDLILLNGRTVLDHCYPFLNARFGFEPIRRTLDLGQTTCELWTGDLQILNREIQVVGWSANIVNSPLRKSTVEALVAEVRVALETV